MPEPQLLAVRFEEQRPRLRAVAHRILGSSAEADDAVQEAWLRLSRADAARVEDLAGWSTTVVTRICLNLLRARERRREEPLDVRLPDPVVGPLAGPDPEDAAVLTHSVRRAVLVVLETLSPVERLVFVLHDLFAVPFEDIAEVVGRSRATTRQLASRARRRVRGRARVPAPDRSRQREVVEAFLAAARDGDLARLVAVLDPEVVLRADAGPAGPVASRLVRGADRVAEQALLFTTPAGSTRQNRLATVNGATGWVAFRAGEPFAVLAATVVGRRITALDVLADPARIARLDLTGVR